jgi:ADP-ribosyl-[dinitrogen reductase] hydrolase
MARRVPAPGVAERVVGCLLGLALGDALGAPFEFSRGVRLPEVIPAFELPWKGRPPGSTTDDTAMALNLAMSLTDRGALDPDDLVRRHLAWFRSEPPDVGSITRAVLSRVAAGERAEEAARREWENRGPETSAGNGSVMYCAPLGVAYANRPEALTDLSPRLSALTHHDERCGTAVLAVTMVAAALVRGEGPPRAVRAAVDAVLDRPGGEELEFQVDAAGTSRPVDGPDRGFCLFTAGLGLQAVLRPAHLRQDTFERETRRIVGLGGDTDTNAAVAGALLGAWIGFEALPRPWLARLQGRAAIERAGRELVPLALRKGNGA